MVINTSEDKISRFLAFCCLGFFSLGLIACAATTAGAREMLHTPFNPPATDKSLSNPGYTCPKSPADPVQDLYFQSVYDQSDPSRSRIDPESQKKYLKAIMPLRKFEKKLVLTANDYLRSGESAYAECVLDWLYQWTKKDALLGGSNMLGEIVRHWSLASLASAYAQIKDEDKLDKTKQQAVEDWLTRIADRVISDYPLNSNHNRKKNNHLYWAAWAVTLTGTATNDWKLYKWGVGRAKYALLTQLHGDGTFPLELARRKKAFHYHVFAAAPLIMIAETGLRNGDDLYKVRDGIIHRLVKRIVYEMDNPGYFENKTGIKQIGVTKINSAHFAWMEAYNFRHPRSDIAAWLDKFRPVFQRRIGGDMSFIFQHLNS